MSEVTEILQRATQLLDMALDAGADEADVYLRQGPATRITFQQDHCNESSGWQSGLALRVWCDNRLALLSTNDLSAAGLATIARQAVLEARQRGISSPAWLNSELRCSPFALAQESLLTQARKRAMIEEVMATISSKQPATGLIVHACYAESTSVTGLVNSRGLRAVCQTSNYRIWIWAEGAFGHLTMAASSQCFAGLDLEALGQHVSDHLVFLHEPSRQAPAGSCEVLLPPLAAADIARSLGVLLTAENVLQDLKPLLKSIDHPIASPAVSLIDDGALPTGLKSRPFDDEGTPVSATTLVEQGRLRAFLHTLRSADLLNATPGGNALKPSLWQPPRAAPSNVYLQAGRATPDELRQQLQRGIIVTSILRPGRIQGTSGKFTLVVQGWWIEQGQPRYPVSGVPISANIFELLRNVRACGSDLQFSPLADGAGAPSLLIARVQVG